MKKYDCITIRRLKPSNTAFLVRQKKSLCDYFVYTHEFFDTYSDFKRYSNYFITITENPITEKDKCLYTLHKISSKNLKKLCKYHVNEIDKFLHRNNLNINEDSSEIKEMLLVHFNCSVSDYRTINNYCQGTIKK